LFFKTKLALPLAGAHHHYLLIYFEKHVLWTSQSVTDLRELISNKMIIIEAFFRGNEYLIFLVHLKYKH